MTLILILFHIVSLAFASTTGAASDAVPVLAAIKAKDTVQITATLQTFYTKTASDDSRRLHGIAAILDSAIGDTDTAVPLKTLFSVPWTAGGSVLSPSSYVISGIPGVVALIKARKAIAARDDKFRVMIQNDAADLEIAMYTLYIASTSNDAAAASIVLESLPRKLELNAKNGYNEPGPGQVVPMAAITSMSDLVPFLSLAHYGALASGSKQVADEITKFDGHTAPNGYLTPYAALASLGTAFMILLHVVCQHRMRSGRKSWVVGGSDTAGLAAAAKSFLPAEDDGTGGQKQRQPMNPWLNGMWLAFQVFLGGRPWGIDLKTTSTASLIWTVGFKLTLFSTSVAYIITVMRSVYRITIFFTLLTMTSIVWLFGFVHTRSLLSKSYFGSYVSLVERMNTSIEKRIVGKGDSKYGHSRPDTYMFYADPDAHRKYNLSPIYFSLAKDAMWIIGCSWGAQVLLYGSEMMLGQYYGSYVGGLWFEKANDPMLDMAKSSFMFQVGGPDFSSIRLFAMSCDLIATFYFADRLFTVLRIVDELRLFQNIAKRFMSRNSMKDRESDKLAFDKSKSTSDKSKSESLRLNAFENLTGQETDASPLSSKGPMDQGSTLLKTSGVATKTSGMFTPMKSHTSSMSAGSVIIPAEHGDVPVTEGSRTSAVGSTRGSKVDAKSAGSRKGSVRAPQ